MQSGEHYQALNYQQAQCRDLQRYWPDVNVSSLAYSDRRLLRYPQRIAGISFGQETELMPHGAWYADGTCRMYAGIGSYSEGSPHKFQVFFRSANRAPHMGKGHYSEEEDRMHDWN